MARKRFGINFKGFEDYMAKLDEIGNTQAMQRGVESALKSAKNLVNPKIKQAMAKGNLPAGGKYSTGDTLKSLDEDMTVEWEGMKAYIKVGFDFKKSGLKSIFLMYGTPRMKPVPGLKDAIYGNKTKKEVEKAQIEALNKTIKRIMEGK